MPVLWYVYRRDLWAMYRYGYLFYYELRGDPPAAVHKMWLGPPLDLPFGEVARSLFPLPLHLPPYAQEY